MMKFDKWKEKAAEELDRDRLSALESRCGHSLPAVFIEWLTLVNGASPEKKCLEIAPYGLVGINKVYGLNNSKRVQIDIIQEQLEGNLPKNFLAFADTGGGDEFVIALTNSIFKRRKIGNVFYWDHETSHFVKIADDMYNFNKLLKDDPDLSELDDWEEILTADDDESLKVWLISNSVEYVNDNGTSIFELAALRAAKNCIKLLHSEGATPGRSLSRVEPYLEYEEEKYGEIVNLIKNLYPSEDQHIDDLKE